MGRGGKEENIGTKNKKIIGMSLRIEENVISIYMITLLRRWCGASSSRENGAYEIMVNRKPHIYFYVHEVCEEKKTVHYASVYHYMSAFK